MPITLEQAIDLALKLDPRCDAYRECDDGFEFWWDSRVDMPGLRHYCIAKESGEVANLPSGSFGSHTFGPLIREGAIPAQKRTVLRALRDAVYGAAVGDALGVPFEFMARDTFQCVGMSAGGAHHQPAGTFSDDTSMMLATCDSVLDCGGINVEDMRGRFEAWLYRGDYAVDGNVFDCGNTVASALRQKRGMDSERSNGNGSLMRIAPLAYFDVSDDDVRAVSAITHAHRTSTESCVCFVGLLRDLAGGKSLKAALQDNVPSADSFAFLLDVASRPRSEIRSGGYVLDTLGAAIWCFANTSGYADCVLAAVNLGSDSDTTAAVAGALAGAVYGYGAIPTEWLKALRGKAIIEGALHHCPNGRRRWLFRQ